MSEVESAEARASEYHLSWNNYEASIASFLKILSTAKEGEEDLSDVTISCSGGKQFSAHRLVLATCSSYFRQLFVGRSINASGSGCHAHPIVYIPDMTDRVMEHLLAFMYTGQTTVPTHLLLPLIEAAKLLGIQGLTEPGKIEGLEEGRKEQKMWKPEMEGTQLTVINGQHKEEEEVEEEGAREKVAQEMAKPDSSNSLIFPALQQAAPAVFPSLSLASPLALGLAPHLGIGLDLSQHLGIGQGRRRKSSPPTAIRSPKLTSPNSSTTTSSNQVNSSSNGPYQHYPPTEDPTRPFACTQCPKRFRMKHHLKEHTLIHSGEMPFSCHLCPKRFNRSYTLKNHMKLHSAGSLTDKFQGQDDPSSTDMMALPPLLTPPTPSFQ